MQDTLAAWAAQEQESSRLAASCDRTHLFVVWGLTPQPPLFTPPADACTSSPAICGAQDWHSPSVSDQHDRLTSHSGSSTNVPRKAGPSNSADIMTAAQNADHNLTDRDSILRHGDFRGLTGPDDLVASLRRLRPHLHASDPFHPRSAAASTRLSTQAAANRSPRLDQQAQPVPGRSAEASMSQDEQPESSSAAEAQQGQHSTARPPWSCLKGHPCTTQQLRAMHHCCNTVACFDIFPMNAHRNEPTRSSQDTDKGQSGQGCSKQPHQGQGYSKQPHQEQGCMVQPLWHQPVVAAAFVSAGDGAVAVACSDGMLLLLNQATGKLIRWGPQSTADTTQVKGSHNSMTPACMLPCHVMSKASLVPGSSANRLNAHELFAWLHAAFCL